MIRKIKNTIACFTLVISTLCTLENHGANAELLPEIFIKRHSGTDFESTPVDDLQQQALIEAARLSPSSYNDQPWTFIFCDKYTDSESYLMALDSIYGQEWVEEAPLLVVVLARNHFLYNGKENDWAAYDTGAAALSLSLAASEMGLMAHQIGGFDPEQILEDFQIPEGFTPLTLIAVGYESKVAAKLPRVRRPVEENFFKGKWGHPFR